MNRKRRKLLHINRKNLFRLAFGKDFMDSKNIITTNLGYGIKEYSLKYMFEKGYVIIGYYGF